jgi:hypothetical protein
MAKTQVQNITQTTSNIGEAQRPYYNTLMQGAAGLLRTDVPIYQGGDRLEGFTQQQKNLQNQIAGMQTPGQFGQASNYLNTAAQGTLANAQYNPGQFNAQQIGMPNLNYFQMQAPQQFGSAQAQQYMSPFLQQALEPQMREAVTSARRGQVAQDLGSSRQGTYGGSRQRLASMERERNLGQQLGDIQSRGLQSAFENAQQQFERDRAAGMTAGMENLRANLGTQQLGTTTGLEALRANQTADLERQRMGEQSRQFGAGHGLSAYGQMGQLGQTMTNLGSAQQQADLARYGLQTSTAAQEQAFGQQLRDLDYGDFEYERDYPYMQYQRYANLMSGVPQATTSTQTTSGPRASIGSQLLSGGVGALSMYNMANRAGVI